MAGIWKSDEFVKGGLKSITKFRGKLSEVEADVEGQYGPQLRFTWTDVEILESGDEVILEDATYTDWVKQSSRKNSVNEKMVADIEAFCARNAIDPDALPDALYGLDLIWERASYDFGEKMSPGSAIIPVEKAGGNKKAAKPAKLSTSPGRAPTKTAPKDAPPDNGDDPLAEAVLEAVGEDGATTETIRRALMVKASLRAAVAKAGGVAKILERMVEAEQLLEDEGTYTRAG